MIIDRMYKNNGDDVVFFLLVSTPTVGVGLCEQWRENVDRGWTYWVSAHHFGIIDHCYKVYDGEGWIKHIRTK